MTDGLSHGSRRSWIRVATEILGLEQYGNTGMTVMEDEDNTLRMTQEVSNTVCKLQQRLERSLSPTMSKRDRTLD